MKTAQLNMRLPVCLLDAATQRRRAWHPVYALLREAVETALADPAKN